MEHRRDMADRLDARVAQLEGRARRQRRWVWIALAVGLVAAVSVPVQVFGLGPVPNNFTAGGVVSASDINENFAYLQAGITAAEGQVPGGTVAFFDLDACPSGWTEYDLARGRTILARPSGGVRGVTAGEALGDGELRTITEVPMHSHGMSGAGSVTSSLAGEHAHAAGTTGSGIHVHTGTTDTAGEHDHGVRVETAGGYGTGYVMGTVNQAGGTSSTVPIEDAGDHAHPFTTPSSGTGSGGHGHGVTVAPANGHRHDVSLGGLSVSSTGAATVDVTMPYVQLLACRRD